MWRQQRNEGQDITSGGVIVAGEEGDAADQRVVGRLIRWVGQGDGVAVGRRHRNGGQHAKERNGRRQGPGHGVMVCVMDRRFWYVSGCAPIGTKAKLLHT